MPRRRYRACGGLVFHVFNRANRRSTLFFNDADYQSFHRVMVEAAEQ